MKKERGIVTSFGYTDVIATLAVSMLWNQRKGLGSEEIKIHSTIVLPSKGHQQQGKGIESRLRKECKERGIVCGEVECRINPLFKVPSISLYALEEGTKERKERVKHKGGASIFCIGYPGLSTSIHLWNQEAEAVEKRFSGLFRKRWKNLEESIWLKEEWLQCLEALDNVYFVGEGGIFSVLWEVAKERNQGLVVNLQGIPLRQEVIEICEYFGINPYYTLSSGCFLVVATEEETVDLRKLGCPVVEIGRLQEGREKLIRRGEEQIFLERPKMEEWYRFLEEKYEKRRKRVDGC